MNPNQKFCCQRCKNQANYMHKNDVYEWEIQMQRARLENIKILENLYENEFLINYEDVYIKFGFDFTAAYIHAVDAVGNKLYRFGNHGLVQVEESGNTKRNKYKIIKLKK